jgi:hypothetical protein
MTTTEPQPDAPRPTRRRFQYSLRTLLVATTLIAVLCSLLSWQVKRAEYQKRCVQAIHNRGGHVYYDYQADKDGFNWTASSRVPKCLLNWLGEDFFHRVVNVELWVLLPCDWEPDREQVAFDKGCLATGTKVPNSWERYGLNGTRNIIWPGTVHLNADDWARAALRQHKFGCDRVTIHEDYCRNAITLDPHNIQANLLLGEVPCDEDAEQRRIHLETVVAHASPESLEYAQARKLLSREHWTFAELCQRIGPDGILR